MKVLCVSNDKLLIDELAQLCAARPEVREFDVLQAGLEAAARLPEGLADAVLVDAREGASVLPATQALLAAHPGVSVVWMVGQSSPELPLLALRTGVREVIHVPIDAGELSAGLSRITRSTPGAKPALGQVLAFMPMKGGSGASFISTNLGVALAQVSAKPVLLIDLKMQFGDAVWLVSDRKPTATVADLLAGGARLDASMLRAALVEAEPGFFVLPAPEAPDPAQPQTPTALEALLRLAKTQYEFVLLDMPQVITPFTLAALDAADHFYPVMQLTLPCLRSARRVLEVCGALDYPAAKLRPVLNRVERNRGTLSRSDAERVLEVPVFATVPNDWSQVTAALEEGQALVRRHGGSAVVRSLRELAERIVNKPAAARSGLLAGLLRLAAVGG